MTWTTTATKKGCPVRLETYRGRHIAAVLTRMGDTWAATVCPTDLAERSFKMGLTLAEAQAFAEATITAYLAKVDAATREVVAGWRETLSESE